MHNVEKWSDIMWEHRNIFNPYQANVPLMEKQGG